MTQCRTFQCQEQLPGLGACVLRAENEHLKSIIRALIDDVMPDNWADEDLGAAYGEAWRNAMQAVGEEA